jgi:hypothetical protein
MRLPESELTYERVVAECRQQLAASGFFFFLREYNVFEMDFVN